MADPGIVCVTHSCRTKIFCFQLPEMCPVCRSALRPTEPPFRLPHPFVRASQYVCAIVLRPTFGDFLHDYNNCKDLHIAVTTSDGRVVEFDGHGLRTTPGTDWQQSLLVDTVAEPWHDLWDNVLEQTCRQPHWTVEHYDEASHNCYTFVLAFLRALDNGKLSPAASSKTVFCETFIVPKTSAAGKYISLYRKLKVNGHYVEGDERQKQ